MGQLLSRIGFKAVLFLVLFSMGSIACRSEPGWSDDLPGLEGLEEDANRIPQKPSLSPSILNLSQILCTYREAYEALPRIYRSREEARLRASYLLTLARSREQDFSLLARRFSDDPKTSSKDGDLGLVVPAELHPRLEASAFALGEGQVSDIIETPRGFHILYRYPMEYAQAAEIVISYVGAKRYQPRTPRNLEQARQLAEEIHARVKAGASFESEAVQYSDLSNAERGGIMPPFRKGQRHPKFEEIVWQLSLNEISPIVETPTGFHIVKRLEIQRFQIRNLLIAFKPSEDSESLATRTLEEATLLSKDIHEMALYPDFDFAELVAYYSDAPNHSQGGLNDFRSRGELPFEIEQAALMLKPGEISPVIRLERSFQILKRIH